MKKRSDILIVGGGAAGLIAAITAREANRKVTILERKDRILKKLLATGNGRCNYTNREIALRRYHGRDIEKIEPILQRFNSDAAIALFRKFGIEPAIEASGKVFPMSYKASSVADGIRFYAEYIGVELLTNVEIRKIKKGESFKAIAADGESFQAEKLILATGGKASPDLGSNGIGLTIAQELGHKIVELSPILSPLTLKTPPPKGVDGVKVKVTATACCKGEKLAVASGDLLFNRGNVSGDAIFQLSWVPAFYRECSIFIDFLPQFEERELIELLKARKKTVSYLTIEDFLSGIINKKISNALLKYDRTKPCTTLTDRELADISRKLKHFELKIAGSAGFKTAQVTAGGVALNEIDIERMESKIVKNLFFAGEILDVAGECGGFNLNWAWASGKIAGEAAAHI